MFNSNDFEMVKSMGETIPDGIVDGTDHYLDMVKITDILIKIDYNDETSRMHAMMEVINCIFDEEENLIEDRAYGTLIALCFHIINIVNSMDDNDRTEYFDYMKNEALIEIEKDSANLPYWDFEGES